MATVPVDLSELLLDLLIVIEKRTRHMATQDQVNALAEAVDAGVAGIRSDLADLKAANPNLDLSALEASVASLSELDAENPAPEPPTV